MEKNKTAILLSGGMDSIALAYWKKPDHSITIDYGQKPANAEIKAAKEVSEILGIKHHIINIDCSQLGSGDLNGSDPLSISPVTEWWPFRNQLLATLAGMKVVTLGVNELILGSVSTDGCHKDGTPEFYKLLADLMLFQEGGVNIKTPALNLTTSELIYKSEVPKSILLWAHSCHTSNQPCMHCNGCKKYLYVLQSLGLDR